MNATTTTDRASCVVLDVGYDDEAEHVFWKFTPQGESAALFWRAVDCLPPDRRGVRTGDSIVLRGSSAVIFGDTIRAAGLRLVMS